MKDTLPTGAATTTVRLQTVAATAICWEAVMSDDQAATLSATLTEGQKYAICREAFNVYGPIGYATSQHSSRITDEIERVLAARHEGLGAAITALLAEHWPDSGVNGHYLADLLRGEDYGPGCDCTSLCSMGPTCPGAILAGMPGSGCHRVRPHCSPGMPADTEGAR